MSKLQERLGSENSRSDEILVQRFQRDPGSPDSDRAAAELLKRYRDRVYLWCRRYVPEHERALDLAQDVLLRAYRSLAGFQRNALFSSWLYAITRNRCLTEVSRPRLFEESETDFDSLAASGELPDEALEAAQDEEALLTLLRQTLEPTERLAVWLRCCERLPVDEITDLLEIDSASGARGVLQSARRKLRAALDKRRLREGGRDT